MLYTYYKLLGLASLFQLGCATSAFLIMHHADKDHDGKISKREFDKNLFPIIEGRFSTDGMVNEEEWGFFTMTLCYMARKRSWLLWQQADRDKNDLLDVKETIRLAYDKFDTDRDRHLSKEEGKLFLYGMKGEPDEPVDILAELLKAASTSGANEISPREIHMGLIHILGQGTPVLMHRAALFMEEVLNITDYSREMARRVLYTLDTSHDGKFDEQDNIQRYLGLLKVTLNKYGRISVKHLAKLIVEDLDFAILETIEERERRKEDEEEKKRKEDEGKEKNGIKGNEEL